METTQIPRVMTKLTVSCPVPAAALRDAELKQCPLPRESCPFMTSRIEVRSPALQTLQRPQPLWGDSCGREGAQGGEVAGDGGGTFPIPTPPQNPGSGGWGAFTCSKN